MLQAEIFQRNLTQHSGSEIGQHCCLVQKGDAAVFKQKLDDGVHAVDLCDAGEGGERNIVDIQRLFQDISCAGAGFPQQKRFGKKVLYPGRLSGKDMTGGAHRNKLFRAVDAGGKLFPGEKSLDEGKMKGAVPQT